MTTHRHRMTVAALVLLAAGLSACGADPMSPLDEQEPVSADVVDTTNRAPTIPWFSVQTAAAPTIPWH